MNFTDNQPIYLQISRWICDKILGRKWSASERIPSVRELGADLEVNPNTVMRAYEKLQSQGVIYNRRGIGYFVSEDAVQKINLELREQFLNEELPRLFERMSLLGISMKDLEKHFDAYKIST